VLVNLRVKDFYFQNNQKDLEQLSRSITPYVVRLLNDSSDINFDSLINFKYQELAPRITIIDTHGVVLSDTEESAQQMENHKNRGEVILALKKKVGVSQRYSFTVKSDMLYVAVPVIENDQVRVIIRTSYFIHDLNHLFSGLRGEIVNIFFILALLSFVVSYFIAKRITNPIRNLIQAQSEVGEGNFDIKVYVDSKDETKLLAESFNYMVQKIRDLLSEIKNQKDFLNHTIQNIDQPLFVVNDEDRIVLCNDSFKKISKLENCHEKLYWEVFREPILNDLIQSDQIKLKKELKIEDQTYICNMDYIETIHCRILAFYNITNLRKIELIKKDFVTNVSHELRTPLTAIKGFIETLEEIATPEQEHYISVIRRHTDNLINICNDLLVLSQLESNQFRVDKERVDIIPVINKIVDLYKNKLKKKKLKIKVDFEKDFPEVDVDVYRFEQVLINLVDNAIKYSDSGKIIISGEYSEKTVSFSVQDTGIGIDQKELSRVFERFYVVDKSRSRKTGGTGLGLSIIKHILTLHHGTIKVESELGKGSKFTVSLPRS